MSIRPYVGWDDSANVRLTAYSEDAGSTWGPVLADEHLIDYEFADEGSVASDPVSNNVFYLHPDAQV